MRKLLAMTVAVVMLLSSAVYAADTVTGKGPGVDVVAAATGTTTPTTPAPKPTTPTTPAKPPTTVPTTPTTPAPTPAPAPKPVDVITTATQSVIDTNAAFEKAISTKGTWIIATLKDLTFNKPIVLDGVFKNGKKDANGIDAIQRKIALYTQDDKHAVTARFSLTAPSLTIKSPNARIQSGTFNGDIYVRHINFQLVDATVNGTIYFVTQAAKDTFKMDDKSTVTGGTILADVDVVSTASITHDIETFAKALGKDGKWIICPLRDLVSTEPLFVEGTFYNKNNPADKVYRKIGLYTHNIPTNKSIATHLFTLKAPSMTIKSPNTILQYGTFVGDIYVVADGFNLSNVKVDGNIIFTTQSAKNTFKMVNSTVTGKQILADVDTVATASLVRDNASFEKAISKNGTWIPCLLQDLTFDKELVLEGEFKNGTTVVRKIALYTQDAKRVTTRKFTLTAPKLTIKSPNANISKGTFIGDVYVYANNFKLVDAIVDGNVIFMSREAEKTFTMDATSKITGNKIYAVEADVITSATQSVINTNDAFEKGISKDGTWIIATLRDMYFTKDLVIEGTKYYRGDKAQGERTKIALYTQDAKRNVTNSFILSAPKIFVKSNNTYFVNGTVKGDIYVSAPGMNLQGTKVEGNIYFSSYEFVSTFKIDAKSSVTGTFAIKNF